VTDIYKSEAGRREVEGQYRRVLDRWPVPREEIVVPTRQNRGKKRRADDHGDPNDGRPGCHHPTRI
jgi:hypothetical protein